jgi:hypothetical protein
MRLHTLFISAVAAFALFPASAMPQSLAEVARMEEARRKTVRGTAKVYTNDDLVHSRDASATSAPAPADPAAAAAVPPATAVPPAPATKPAASTDAKDEKYWRSRVAAAQQSTSRNKVLLAALEARVNGLNTDFVNMDDPFQRNVIQENLKTAMAELERVKQDVANGTKALTAIEDEARKANVPPGWLR